MDVPQVLAPTDSGSALDHERRGLPVEATAFAGPAASGPAADPSHPGPSAVERSIDRLLDANLDRAREGLRVLEDWARFGLDRADLVARCKDLRQRLGQCHRDRYRAARATATDVAAGMEHPAQAGRRGPEAVLRANAARVQEALRVLEEFGRERDAELAAEAASCRYALYDLDIDLLRAGQVDQDRRSRLAACHLYLITRPMLGLEAMVASALAAGVRLVQYRAKEADGDAGPPLDDQRRLAEARALRALCDRHGALLIINDRIDLALAVEADGVHLGQEDWAATHREQLAGVRIVGLSTHSLEQARQAERAGVDYIGVGPVFSTNTKPGVPAVGLQLITAVAGAVKLPFFAIGGITLHNLGPVKAAGATRVAVVSAILRAPDVQRAAAQFKEQLTS